jgi:hypothetical protein
VIDFTNAMINMTTNLDQKLLKEKVVLTSSQNKVSGLKLPDAVVGWEPVPEPIKRS